MGISIHMLGGFRVACDGETLIDAGWRPAKAAAIVKLLALQPEHTLHRDQLIDLLWPDADAEAGSSSFYKNLHHLRGALRGNGASDLVALHRGAVSLAPGAAIDVTTFRDLGARALATGDVAIFEQALAASGGELLPGDLYEPWTEQHRDNLRSLRFSLQLGLAERLVRRRRYDDAVRRYHEALATQPAAEDAHRGLMRAYALNGQRELALAQYDRCREVLLAELDAPPSAETDALASEIRNTGRLVTAVERAIARPLRAAEAAVRNRDWPAACEAYRQAIARLQSAGPDDEREAELWLALAAAASATTGTEEIAESARRAATLAERAGAYDLASRALVQFQAATDARANNHPGHRESEQLIAAALDRLPPGPSAARARLLAASARPMAAAARPGEERHVTGRTSLAGHADAAIAGRLREAVSMARTAGQVDALSYALSRLRLYITSPDTLDERLAITAELIGMIDRLPNPVSRYEAHFMRHEDLLEYGDLDGARIEARAILRIGDDIGAHGIRAAGMSCLATHATADGDLQGAMSLLFESRKADAAYGDNSNSQYRFGIQFLVIRWHQGRIEELYGPYVRAVDLAPRLNAPRASLALICAESGRLDEARAHLDQLAAAGVGAVPRDYLWWLTVICMGRAAIATGNDAVARDLYAMLLPRAGLNASAAGAVSFGSAALHLAHLAAALGKPEDAVQQFERALEFNVRTRQRTWAARTRHDYALFLATSPATEDRHRAAEFGRIAAADARELGITLQPPVQSA